MSNFNLDSLNGKWYKWIVVSIFGVFAIIVFFLLFVTVPSLMLTSFLGDDFNVAGIENTQILVILFYLYILPAIIAWEKPNFLAITALNVLLGWTIIGWIFALIWSLKVKE